MIGVIPLGGQAARMKGLPKALLPVNDRTLLGELLDKMRAVPGLSSIQIGASHLLCELLVNIEFDRWKCDLYQVQTGTMSETLLKLKPYR